MIPLSTLCSHAKTITSAHCIHFKEERISRLEGLPQFKWNDLGEQDVIGEGSFGAVFIAKTRNKDGKSKQWLTRNHPLLKIPAFKDSQF